MPRIAPAEPPYETEIQSALDRVMPGGVDPLVLFRVLARSPRVFGRFFAGGLLDRGPLSLRQREIAINRTCALSRCAYEWGVHISFFADRAGLTAREVGWLSTVDADPAPWASDERAIIALCDDLHATTRISAGTWEAVSREFDDEQILELIALAGFYRTVACFANGLDLPLESYGAPLPSVDARSESG